MAYKNPQDPRNREAKLRHYHANKTQYLERQAAKTHKIRKWLDEQKSVPCADCGQSYPSYVMDFDHRDPSIKLGGVRQLATYGWKKVQAEIAKCDVVCANCHRERTWGASQMGRQRLPNPPSTEFDSSAPCDNIEVGDFGEHQPLVTDL